MIGKFGLHQQYMSQHEYKTMINSYERLSGDTVCRKETTEEKAEREKRKPYYYDLDKAAERILNRKR